LKKLLTGLLQKDPNLRYGFREIITSEWFQIDFKLLYQKKLAAPYIPNLINNTDVSNFDNEFTD
jgi:hypothetical protein